MTAHKERAQKWWLVALGLASWWLVGTAAVAGAAPSEITADGTIAMGVDEKAAAPEAAAAPENQPAEAEDSEPQSAPAGTGLRLTKITVSEEAGQPLVRIFITGKAGSSIEYLANPDRALLKIRNTRLTWKPATLAAGNPPLQRIRSAQHGQDIWVVLDMAKNENWFRETNRTGIILRLSKWAARKNERGPAPAPQTIAPTSEKIPAPSGAAAMDAPNYQVVDVAVQDLGDKTRLLVTTDGQARYRVEREKQGQQFILKISGATLAARDHVARLPIGAVRDVTARQKNEAGEPIVQISAQLSEPVPYLVFKDQNQILVDFTNPGAASSPGRQRGNLNAPVSVDLQNADMRAVLRALANDVGFDLVLTPGMEKAEGANAQVTLSINEQPLKNVLDFILRPRQMTYAVSGNTLRIGLAAEFPLETQVFTLRNLEVNNSHLKESVEASFTEGNRGKAVLEPASNRIIVSAIPGDMARAREIIQQMDVERRLVTRTFSLNYTKAEKVLPLVQPMLSTLGSAKLNGADNAVVVSDIPGNVTYIAKVIGSLDTKSQQVMIEARIVEVSRSNQLDLGVNWNARRDDPAANPQVRATISPRAVASAGQLTVGTLQNGVDLNATLSALEAKGKANTISNPRIATLNNNNATLTASQNIPYATSVVSNGVVSNAINYLELPISLSVTPQITREGQVLLNPMTLNVTTVVGEGTPPRTTTRTATTQMLVDDGETIAIGGMVRDEEVTRESKVPLLGDIPLLGVLFKSTVTTKNKMELVVFLTTHILE